MSNKRSFKKDVTKVLSTIKVNTMEIKFPIGLTEEQRNEEIGVMTNLNNKSYNVLRRAELKTIQDVLNRFDDFVKIRGCGVTTTKNIKNSLLQWWYENLTEDQVKDFWTNFIKMNRVA